MNALLIDILHKYVLYMNTQRSTDVQINEALLFQIEKTHFLSFLIIQKGLL